MILSLQWLVCVWRENLSCSVSLLQVFLMSFGFKIYFKYFLVMIGMSLIISVADAQFVNSSERIQPYQKDARYWQYKNSPILLLGGSKDDSLFQILDLEAHLNELKEAGGNFVRNTMSDRQDHGFEVYPYVQLENGKFDLDVWNEEYWLRFENLLRLTHERDIVVQIEVWDRFDHSQQHWEAGPYRPINNVNYTAKEAGLGNNYPAPAWHDRQPFFHTVPGMPRYKKELEVVRKYQERFVRKLLSYSLKYRNVLYCMNNETSTPASWGRYWIELIQIEAKKAGVKVYCTDMFNDGYKPEQSKLLEQAWEDTHVYGFIDISQINSRLFNEQHWAKLQWVMKRMEGHHRPVNCVKIYGSGETNWGSGKPSDGVERFWRDLFAGCAAVRHHRDGGGIGLQPRAKACIRAARLAESLVRFWEVQSRQDLLTDCESDEAYLLADPGKKYLVYFTAGGSVKLDLSGAVGQLRLQWININSGQFEGELFIMGGESVVLEAPSAGPWVGAIVLLP